MLRKVIWPIRYELWAMSYSFILPVISALLLILAYPKFDLKFLAWVAFVPLFFSLENKNPKQRFIIGYLFGFIFFSGILYWLINVSVPGAIVLIIILSCAPAMFCLYTPSGIVYDILAIPSLWVLTEFLRSHIFTGFPWVMLGYSQYLNLPIIQIADITGVYGVSFLIVLVNFAIYSVIRKFKKRFIHIVIALCGLILTFFYGSYRLQEGYLGVPLEISVIQGNIPQGMKWDPQYKRLILDTYERLTLQAKKENADLIIWPETAIPGFFEGDGYLYTRITDLAKIIDTPLLVGAIRETDSRLHNSAYLISEDGKVLKVYNKIHLVPFGEYIPLEKYIPWLRNFIDKPIGDFDFGDEYTLFRIKAERKGYINESIVKDIRFYNFGVLICFEDIFPYLARNFVKSGAEFMVNITNDAWFGKTSAPYQHLEASVFRAVENRVPVIRSANTGISCFIDQKGRIISFVKVDGEKTFVEGYKQARIVPSYRRTLYTLWGDIFVSISCVIFITALAIKRWK